MGEFKQEIVTSTQSVMKMYDEEKKNILDEFEKYKQTSDKVQKEYLEQINALKMKTDKVQNEVIKEEEKCIEKEPVKIEESVDEKKENQQMDEKQFNVLK